MSELVDSQAKLGMDKVREAALVMRKLRDEGDANPFSWDFEFRLAQALAQNGLI